MNRGLIILVSVDFVNAKSLCEGTQGRWFKTSEDIFEFFNHNLEKDDDFDEDENIVRILELSIDEFIIMCNEQNSLLEHYYVCRVVKDNFLTNLEIYKKWEKEVEFDATMTGDLSDFNSLNIELTDNLYYKIGYDEDNDCFYINKIENEEDDQLHYSNNTHELFFYERLLKQIISDRK